MGVVRTMVTTLFLSVWLMVHAVFLANLPPEEPLDKKLLPLQIRSVVARARNSELLWLVCLDLSPLACAVFTCTMLCSSEASVFHMPWFRALVSDHMNEEMLRFTPTAQQQQQQQPPPSVWTSIFSGSSGTGGLGGGRSSRFYSPRSSSSSSSGITKAPSGTAAAGVPVDWMRPLSWVVTAMTMAEWLTFAYFVWRVLWLTILRPLVLVTSILFILLLGFYCVKGYYYALGKQRLVFCARVHLSTPTHVDLRALLLVQNLACYRVTQQAASLHPDESSKVLSYITAVDEFLNTAGKELLSWNGRVLRGLDQLLSIVFTPASILEQQQQDKQQLLLMKKHQDETDTFSSAAGLLELFRKVRHLLSGGVYEGVPISVRPLAGAMDL